MDELETLEELTPVATEFMRIPIVGPKPWNTLVFIRCEGSLSEREPWMGTKFARIRQRFTSKFKIDEFKQADLKWYRDHTYISATQFITRLGATGESNFILALEDIKGFVDTNGHIGFDSQIAASVTYPIPINFRYSVSAYVLLYEKHDDPPLPVPPTKPGWMPKIEELPSQFRRRRDFRITGSPSVLDK